MKYEQYTVFKSQFYHPKLTFYLTSYLHHPITSNKNTAMACVYHPKLSEDMILKSVLDGKTETFIPCISISILIIPINNVPDYKHSLNVYKKYKNTDKIVIMINKKETEYWDRT